MERQAMAEKILVLGVDGLDPRLTSKYVSQGMMPNVEKFIQAGSARKDLVLLGGMPTVTPPIWRIPHYSRHYLFLWAARGTGYHDL